MTLIVSQDTGRQPSADVLDALKRAIGQAVIELGINGEQNAADKLRDLWDALDPTALLAPGC